MTARPPRPRLPGRPLCVFVPVLSSLACTAEKTAPSPAEAPREPPTAIRDAGPSAPPLFVTGTSTVAERFALKVRVTPYETFVDMHPLREPSPEWRWRPTSRVLRLDWGRDGAAPGAIESLRDQLDYLVSERALDLAKTRLLLELSPRGYSNYSERLARHAAEDPAWPSRARAVTTRQLHDYVMETTRKQALHPELDEVFASRGVQPRLRGVEKCLRSTRKMDAASRDWLRERDLSPRSHLPLGCLMAVFELSPHSP